MLKHYTEYRTGTQAGDPLEMASVREVFGGPNRGLLNIGSLKGNIGHAETAAGVASLLKVLAMLNNAGIPPQASHRSLNPKIPALESDNMTIAAKLAPWTAPLLAACVNSYGAGGSNCALICCERPPGQARLPEPAPKTNAESTYPIIMSAASVESLRAAVQDLGRYLEKTTSKPDVGDLAFTLSKRRKLHRQALITHTSNVDTLARQLRNETCNAVEVPQAPKQVVLAFGGQTKKTVNMERSLYETIPNLKRYIDDCDSVVRGLGFPSLLPAIFQQEPLTDVVTLQCGTFAMQYACARCWIEAGLEVVGMIGHSFGELTAMVATGIFSLHDGLRLISSRASLMATKWGREKGTMLVIHSTRETVQSIIDTLNDGSAEPKLEVACYNSPSSQVVVGSSLAIDEAESLLAKNTRFSSIKSQRLDVTHGFHSKFTEGILGGLTQVSQGLTYSKPVIHLEASTAEPDSALGAARPAQHAREPVHFEDAVRRLESRLGPCVWLEAGMDSPVIPMIKRAMVSPESHVFQALKISDAQVPTQVLATATANLWREGIPVTFWPFLTPKKHSFKQIWLPPYQFQPTGHWLQNVDRVKEAQKNAVVEQKVVVEKVQEPQAPPKLVSLAKDADKLKRSNDFTISLDTQRFTKIVSGHAVRQRPLCPASMYMECAAMGLQLLQGPIEGVSLGFLDLSFQAALGVDLTRTVSLTLDRTDDSQVWSFVIKSSPKTDARPRTSTHAVGKVLLTAPPDLRTYERLISRSIEILRSKSDTEKLMSNRAYGLFAQVVHYADFLQGISDIILDTTEAVASIELSKDAIIGLEESTVSQYCDTIAIDTFIQVVGLLINSSKLVTSEDVYVATGVDRMSMSPQCNFYEQRSWIVYTKFTTTGEGQAAGDVFVLTCEGRLAMIISGAQFTKLLIVKLERFLDSANSKPQQATVAAKRDHPPIPLKSEETTSTITTDEGMETPPDLDSSSVTSIDSDDELETPEGADDGAQESLRNIISDYTGVSPEDIAEDSNIADLGVDSLAAVELAEELQSQFGKEIAAEELLDGSYRSIAGLLIPAPSAKKVKPPKAKKSRAPVAVTPPSRPASPPISRSKGPDSTQGLQIALKLLSETSGAPADSIEGTATLSELGIDSLSAVELKGDLEDAFAIEIEDDRFTLDSKVKEVLDFLGVGASKPSASQSTPSTKAEKRQPTNEKSMSSQDSGDHGVELGSPMEALIQCEASFDQAAVKRGFLNYWSQVAPKQDELLLAYICEAFNALGSDLGKISPGQQVPLISHLPRHGKVMKRLLEILEKHGLLTQEGSKPVRGQAPTPAQASGALHEEFLTRFPAYAGEARLMALTGPKLADCLTGKTDPISLMFRGAVAQKVMEEYYVASPMLSTLTEQLVTFIQTVVKSSVTKSRDARMQILEVGAGFGGTTTRLAEVLESTGIPVRYTFTDISSSLVKGAKTKFAKYPWMEYQVLNLENDMPASLKGRYDIVIGTNCVHATTNKTKTVGRLREILNPQGFLVLSEVTQLVDWYDIVFGLLEGWWLANDGSTYPLQPPESWVKSFETAGYSRISYSQGSSLESNTQRLLVASRNQKVTAPLRKEKKAPAVQTVVYKEVDGTSIEADIYLPSKVSAQAMPIGTCSSYNPCRSRC